MTDEKPAPLAVLRPGDLALLVVGAVLVGCARVETFPDGHAIEVPSNAGWYGHWLIAVAAALVALLGLFAIVASVASGESGTLGVAIFFALVGGGTAVHCAPARTSPREQAESAVATYRTALEARAQAASAEQRATPAGQLALARKVMTRLDQHIKEQLDPLRKKYVDERDGYIVRLRTELPKTGLKTHAALLAARDEHAEVAGLIVRVAVLERAMRWLDDKRASAIKALRTLDQKTWMLQKLVELDDLAPEADRVEIAGIVAAADAIVDEKLDPPAKQELGALEAQVFTRVLTGGGK